MKRNEQLLSAIGEIGDDLIVMAEQRTFSRGFWQKALPVAACLVLLTGAAVTLKPQFVQLEPAAPAVETKPDYMAEKQEMSAAETEKTPDEEMEKTPAFTAELKSQPFYIFDSDPENDNGPSKAIAPDGAVLLETASGQIEPLIDRLTGEYLAIMVCHRTVGTAVDGYVYDIYTLGGEQVVSGLQAYDVDCLGNIILVQSTDGNSYTASCYQRDTYAMLRSDFSSGMIVGDCIWITPQNRAEATGCFMDGDGALITTDEPINSYFVWQNRAYFVVGMEETGLNLIDSKGRELITGHHMRACYGISNGYARCEDKNGHYLVDLSTGKEVFRWDWPILDAFENHVILHTADLQYALADWNGNVLTVGSSIQPVDDDADGDPELFVVDTVEGTRYVNAAGDVLVTIPTDRSMVQQYVTSRTLLTYRYLDEDQQEVFLIDLTTGERSRLSYTTVSPIWEDNQATGLFYAGWFDEDGEMWCDILREDGTVLLSGLSDLWTRQGDVFRVDNGLIRIDGTWLYQEPA